VEIPWTEKYRPTMLSQLRREKTVDAILSWAKKWEKGIPAKKGLLIYGAPGTGKTSAAKALANEMDWEYMEFNASDVRSKELINEYALKGSYYSSISDEKNRKKLIVMDEVDSLYEANVEGSDGGGKGAISNLLDKTLNPVVLIANDLYSLRSTNTGKAIVDKCELVEFKRYMKTQVISLLKEIASKENIYCPPEKLNEIADNANGDMRAAINDLQGNGEIFEPQGRDTTLTAYSVMQSILHGHGEKGVREIRSEIMKIDIDPNDFILYLLENVFPLNDDKREFLAAMQDIRRASIFLGRVRKRMNYSLWSYSNDFMSLVSTHHLKSKGFVKFAFPSLIKNMAVLRRYRGIRDNFSTLMGRYIHKSSSFVNRDSFQYIYFIIQRDEEFRRNIEEATGLDTDDVLSLQL
jgi:replication factor C large subunit